MDFGPLTAIVLATFVWRICWVVWAFLPPNLNPPDPAAVMRLSLTVNRRRLIELSAYLKQERSCHSYQKSEEGLPSLFVVFFTIEADDRNL